MSKKIIFGSIPYDEPLHIKISENEIPVCTGDFYRMREAGMFSEWYEDKDDSCKLIGLMNGNIYVSCKDYDDMTDDELNNYCERSGLNMYGLPGRIGITESIGRHLSSSEGVVSG